MAARILIVEDDIHLAGLIKTSLVRQDYIVDLVADGQEAMQLLENTIFDALILDWQLPGANGIEILRHLRRRKIPTAVLMLTGNDTYADKEIGFETGADDYICKPADIKELVLRVRALLRRPRQMSSGVISIGPFRLDPSAHTLFKDDQEIRLRKAEFALLEFFMCHPEQTFTAETLLLRLWDLDAEASGDALKSCIARLRRQIDQPGRLSYIRNAYKLGYKFTIQQH